MLVNETKGEAMLGELIYYRLASSRIYEKELVRQNFCHEFTRMLGYVTKPLIDIGNKCSAKNDRNSVHGPRSVMAADFLPSLPAYVILLHLHPWIFTFHEFQGSGRNSDSLPSKVVHWQVVK